MPAPWKKGCDKARQHIKKQRHDFANEDLSSQSYGFFSIRVWMWKLDHKEGWVPKNWYFWTVVLEKILESPWDSKEIKPVNPKGNQSRISLERLMLKLKLQYFGHLMCRADSLEKTLMLGKIEERRTRDETVGWHHRLNGQESEKAPGVGDGQGSLACCSPCSLKRDGHDWSDLAPLALEVSEYLNFFNLC